MKTENAFPSCTLHSILKRRQKIEM